MKILVISHSCCHQRQQWFFKKLGKLAGHCTIVGPATWGNLQLKDMANKTFSTIGLPVINEGDIFKYCLHGIEEVIHEIKPDIIYCQAELKAFQTLVALNAAMDKNIPFVVFVWENIFPLQSDAANVILHKSKAIICGNQDAKKLLPDKHHDKCYILPQVGVELEYFKPYFNIEKKFDVIFCGRPVAEKGLEIIKQGCNELNCSLNIIHGQDYEKIPKLLCEGKIFASLPITTPEWKEQSGSYANLEAMACGLPVITTRCGAILEYLENSACYCEENNLESFIGTLKKLIFDDRLKNQYIDLGFVTVKKFSNETIAEKLLEIFKKCISETR